MRKRRRLITSILAIILAISMVAGIGISAFAADTETQEDTTEELEEAEQSEEVFYQEKGTTLEDYLDKSILAVDPVKLISLAILKNVDYQSVKVNNRTIVDALTEDQKYDYNFSVPTVEQYKKSVEKARTGLAEDWDLMLTLNYMQEAFDIYDNYIADVLTIDSSTDEIKSLLTEYVAQTEALKLDLGEINTAIINNLTTQKLISLQVSEPIPYTNEFGEYDIYYVAEKTKWMIYEPEFTNFFDGKITDLTENSITVSVGTDASLLSITYSCDEPFTLLKKDAAVGTEVAQGEKLFNCENNPVTLELKYNDKYIDILKLMGTQAKVLLGEYSQTMSEAYSANRDAYLSDWLAQKNE